MRRRRVSPAEREKVVRMLRRGVSAQVRRALAEEHGVDPRTLRNWLRRPPGRAGRPPASQEHVQEASEACRAVLEEQGYGTWWKIVWEALGRKYSKYRVQECTRELKEEHEATGRLLAALVRVSVRVRLGDVLWSLDETHLGRLEDGEAVLGLVVREVASTRTLVVSVGPAATAEDLVRALEHLRLVRGGLPLVVAMDNGPAMKSGLVADYLAFHEVVALRSLPRVSRHNPWVEAGHRRLKEAAGLGKGVILHGHAEAAAAMARAVEQVDGRRLVATRAMRTPEAVDAATPRWYASVDRRAFYGAACRAIGEAVQGCANDRERRKAEREAILSVLEDLALISRTRGGAPLAP